MKIETVGENLVITVPLNVKPAPSKSGKSMVIATTNGFVRQSTAFGVVSVGLNVTGAADGTYTGRPQGAPEPAKPALVKGA